jgi:hypothetical protein
LTCRLVLPSALLVSHENGSRKIPQVSPSKGGVGCPFLSIAECFRFEGRRPSFNESAPSLSSPFGSGTEAIGGKLPLAILIQNERQIASSIQKVDSDDSIVSCQRDAADVFDSIGPKRSPGSFRFDAGEYAEIGLKFRRQRFRPEDELVTRSNEISANVGTGKLFSAGRQHL